MLIITLLPSFAVSNANETLVVSTEDTACDEVDIENGWETDPYQRLGVSSNDGVFGLPASYDPRDDDFLTEGKEQDKSLLCWMFSSVGAVEQYTSKLYGSKFDISEAHGAAALSKSIIPSGYSGFNGYYKNIPNNRGNYAKALQYLTNWNTPIFTNTTCQWNTSVTESSYPLSKVYGSGITEVAIDEDFTDSQPLLNVTGAKYINNNMNDIKQAIMAYGSVGIAMDFDRSIIGYDSNKEPNYFCSKDSSYLSHAVMIVGWNDNYSKNNFTKSTYIPPDDGAWLVRNSFNFCQYFWLSYYEGCLTRVQNNVMAITGVEKASNNEYMLSYDYYPTAYTGNYFNDVVYLCNVFDVSEYTDTYSQIDKVMLYLRTTGCTYDIKIVQLDYNGNMPNNLDNVSSLATGQYTGEGYFTVNLNTPYNFVSNNKCAVIVKLTPTSTDSKIYIPYESDYASENILLEAEINDGESYFGFYENNIVWTDCNDNNQYNISGNLIIRPVLRKSTVVEDNITITPSEIVDNDSDVDIEISSMDTLFNIHTTNNVILREGTDYDKLYNRIYVNNNRIYQYYGIKLYDEYINSLNGNYTELIFEFCNDTSKTVIVNPKSVITDVSIQGSPIVGDTLTATCTGEPEKESYDVNYRWQYSINGAIWSDVAGANSASYTVTDNDFGRYLRVAVTPISFGNVKTGKISDFTACKVVILDDVDLNGTITIDDSTLVSKYIADIVTLTDEQLLAADADRNGVIDIEDVTLIQRHINQ